jgi:hypothetical protein
VSGEWSVRAPGDPAHTPDASPRSTCLCRRVEQFLGEAPSLAAEEVRGRCPATNELDVDVHLAGDHVAQQASVAVDVVETRVALELDRSPGTRQPLELRERRAGMALALAELGRVDLDEPDALSASHIERVAVPDARYDGARGRIGLRARAADGREPNEECGRKARETDSRQS